MPSFPPPLPPWLNSEDTSLFLLATCCTNATQSSYPFLPSAFAMSRGGGRSLARRKWKSVLPCNCIAQLQIGGSLLRFQAARLGPATEGKARAVQATVAWLHALTCPPAPFFPPARSAQRLKLKIRTSKRDHLGSPLYQREIRKKQKEGILRSKAMHKRLILCSLVKC